MSQARTDVIGAMSRLDRYLPLLIFAAMALGVLVGAAVPGVKGAFNALSMGSASLPIAIGLMWMMYPVLARVRYEGLARSRKQESSSPCR